MIKYLINLFFVIINFVFLNISAQAQDKEPVQIKLYAIDCGRIDVANFAAFSDTGEYDNKTVQLSDPCFLIVHPKGTLLWDTGLSDTLVNNPKTISVYHLTKSATLGDSLKKINLKPSDINYVAVSHSHFDHMSELNQLSKATWILQKAELKYAHDNASTMIIDPSTLSNWKAVHKTIISGDYDVFGDGTVKILSAPGHTPGHESLEILLPQSGVVILSGDEYHQRASVKPLLVPVFNVSRADTMASSDRINRLLTNTKGRLVVQHDSQDFEKLPKYPEYLK